MGFADSFDRDSADMGSDYYKFKEGEQKLRIMSEPLIKVSRFGYGVCYEGAQFCKAEILEAESKKTGKEARLDKKWEVWAIVRGDSKKGTTDKFAIVDLPYGLAKEIKGYMMPESEYHFETFPMPFDIKVIAEDAGTMKVKYSIQPARKNTDVTESELKELAEKMTIETIIEKQKEKSRAKFEGSSSSSKIDYPADDINPDDIPF